MLWQKSSFSSVEYYIREGKVGGQIKFDVDLSNFIFANWGGVGGIKKVFGHLKFYVDPSKKKIRFVLGAGGGYLSGRQDVKTLVNSNLM